MAECMRRLLPLAERFALEGRIRDIRPHGSGLINDTFLIVTEAPGKAILQRINRSVFPHPERIQANLRTLGEHLRQNGWTGSADLRLPEVVPTRSGQDYLDEEEDGFWRVLSFIEGAHHRAAQIEPPQAEEMGRVLGRFHALLTGLNPARLHVTLPGFHVTPGYLARFDRVWRESLSAASVPRDCLDFIERRRMHAGALEEARLAGLLPLRAIHGDPKLDNVLFDTESGRAISLIDLDTVQPGLVHYDLGDCLRSCCRRAGPSPDRGTVAFDLDLCRAVLRGYLNESGDFLIEAERSLFFEAIRLLPFELGLRFLTDYLEGDVYFKVSVPGQNLRRALEQFRLAEIIERHETSIRAMLDSSCG